VDSLHERRVSELNEVDRRLATEIVMGVLRWRGELDFQVERLSTQPVEYFDPEIATILRMGVYQIQFLERIPQRAVVNEAVELTKVARKSSAAGLVNAVLRKCQPPPRQMVSDNARKPDPQLGDAVRRSFPPWLLVRWAENFGPEAADALAWASNVVPPTTLRVCAGTREEVRQRLADEGIVTEPCRYAPGALVVCSGNVLATQVCRRGEVVIHDEASQLVGLLVATSPGQRVLDLCAAPGIKTSQMAAGLMQGLLVAGDVSQRRLNTMRWLLRGRVREEVRLHLIQFDATLELPFGCRFDRILVDAPCSGTGTLARNPEIKWRLQPRDLGRFAEMQTRMVRNALKALAPGGRLVYSTCSLEPEENEQVVEGIMREAGRYRTLTADELSAEFPRLKTLFDSRGYFHTRPDLHPMDGFCAAIFTAV
jgi:16S rRNA (cytosine967-C5)-methyltransferase